ncbi:MAG: hypothetical protein LBF92_08710, partial [Synergistaceae bacterium]|nr:hypothetical protein [Synergistaceae bacterium]
MSKTGYWRGMASAWAASTLFLRAFCLCAALLFHGGAVCAAQGGGGAFKPFVPADPIMPISQVKPGMKGICRTVVQGSEIVSFPVEVLDVIPRSGVPANFILIRASGKVIEDAGGIAAGMSGSPLYIDGKLAGAIGYAWRFSRHDMGLVTPIEDMMEVWNYPERIPSFAPAPLIPEKPPGQSGDAASGDMAERWRRLVSRDVASRDEGVADSASFAPVGSGDLSDEQDLSGYVFVGGLSERMSERVGELMGKTALPFGGGSGANGQKRAKPGAKLVPGMAIGASVAWGDVEVSAIGTLSAVAEDGRFVAFAHPFTSLGPTSAVLTEATISRVIPGMETPFKFGYTGDIIGTITQDRPQGIGGRVGIFAPAASCTLNLRDVDAGRTFKRSFQMVQDKFQFSEITAYAIVGLVENLWGRGGAGSAKVTATFSGGALPDGWKRTNVFFSEKDVARDMLQEFNLLTQIFAVNQFQELRPFGIDVNVEVTEAPRVIFVEDVTVPDGPFRPGERVSFDITLRPWRKTPFVRSYSLVIPKNVSGICELLVRGGGIAEEGAEYMEAGWRSISSLPILLGEIDAKETNDQIVLELRGQETLENQIKKARDAEPKDLMNDKLKSEIRSEKMEEGSMRVIRTNYYVDG